MSIQIKKYVDSLKSAFKEEADLEVAKRQKKYMRGQFEFFGLPAPERRKITKEFKKKKNRPDYDSLQPLVKKLWSQPEREFQYFTIELLGKYKKEFDEGAINLFEYMISHKYWWDTVDPIAKNLVGEYLEKYPQKRKKFIQKWLASGNIWLQRTAIIFQLGYKEETDEDLLFSIIEKLQDSNEFFIQKAIGWALREHSKINPEPVKEFIKNHDLSNLAEREGTKKL